MRGGKREGMRGKLEKGKDKRTLRIEDRKDLEKRKT